MLLGFLGFRFWKVKNASPTQGFEHVKGYAGSDAGKRGVCREHVSKPSRSQRAPLSSPYHLPVQGPIAEAVASKLLSGWWFQPS